VLSVEFLVFSWAWSAICNCLIINNLSRRGQTKQAAETGRAAAALNHLIINNLHRFERNNVHKKTYPLIFSAKFFVV